MKYLFFTALFLIIVLRIFWFAIDALASRIGLIKLIIMQRYFNGKITDQELQDYERDHK
jgi:hypothetical protein